MFFERKGAHMKGELDRQILLHIHRDLPPERIEEISGVLAGNLDEYMRFKELGDLLQEEREELSKKEPDMEKLKKEWNQYARMDHKRFDVLMEQYFNRYQKALKAKGEKGTVANLNAAIGGHNKWYRMKKDHGFGKQYREDMRRLCFLFKLSYTEAIEFLWSAGQPLDSASARDYVIAQCLVKQEYEQEKIDERLKQIGKQPLFWPNQEGGRDRV